MNSGKVILAGVYRGLVDTILRRYKCPFCSRLKLANDCYLIELTDPQAVHEDQLGRRVEVIGSRCGRTWLAKRPACKNVHRHRKTWWKSKYLQDHLVYLDQRGGLKPVVKK